MIKVIKNMGRLNGNLRLCENCREFCCCKTVVNGFVEAPFLTQYDINTIISSKKFSFIDQFAVQRINPITKEKVYTLQTNDYGCKFFSKANNKCEIHDIRPLDCQIFPLDILIRNGKYKWVLYKLCEKYCTKKHYDDFKISQLKNLLVFAETKLLPILKESSNLKNYATFESGIITSCEYEVLKEVSF